MEQYSYSQVRSFLSCENKWYTDKVLGIKAVEVKRAPTMGSAIHHAIAARINQEDINKQLKLFIEEKEKDILLKMELYPDIEDDWTVVKAAILKDVPWIVDAWTKWVELDDWETIVDPTYGPMVERRMVTNVADTLTTPEFEFVWIADWVAKHKKTGLTWLVDWKSTTQFKDDRHHEFALQKMIYQYLLYEIDVEISGSRVAQIKPTSPAVPSINKNGSMSRSAIATTWDRYKESLMEAGLDPSEYVDMKEKLKSPSDWFQWSSAFRTIKECENAWDQIVIPTIQRMNYMRMWDKTPVRNLGSLDCHTLCSVKLICMETLRGRPIDGLLDFGFERKDTNIVEVSEVSSDGVQGE